LVTETLLAMESLKLIGGFSAARLPGRIFVQHLITNKSAYHQVVRMPWCEICGGAGETTDHAASAAASLNNLNSTEELRTVLEGFIDERVGVIRTLTASTGGAPFTLPMTATATLAGYTEGSLQPFQLFQTGAGKGLTEVGASLSAAGEAIERYSAARYRTDSLVLAAYDDLGDRAIDPRKLCLYAENQHSQPGFPFPRFSTRRPIHWVRGRWMDNGQEVLVPALLAYFNFQPAPEEYFCQVSSNGLAAGGDHADAGLRALFELVERDAFMLTWICQLPVRRVNLSSGLDHALAEVIRQMTAQGIEVELYLINSGIAIPTIVCLGLANGVRWPATFVSLATHASPAIAASKAILELAHVAPYLASIMRTHRIPNSPDEVMSLEDHALYYARRERSGAFDFMRATKDEVELGQIEGPREPLDAGCVQLLEKAGVRVALVDVTSPDVALSPFRVARAIGTDMQPIHFGHRLQRLGNPRLRALLGGRGPNPNPHPIA
jgi:ribosomal protein S12 methylthiotransferase accessory factor